MSDLIIVTDSTGSMGLFLEALQQALPTIIRVGQLTQAWDRINIIEYKDFCDKKPASASGWYSFAATPAELDPLFAYVHGLEAMGGGDIPEAGKEAIKWMLNAMADKPAGKEQDKRTTTVLWFTDAPMHTDIMNKSAETDHIVKERASLAAAGLPHDWVALSKLLADAGAVVYPLIDNTEWPVASFALWLAHATGGVALRVARSARSIMLSAINVLLAVLDAPHSFGDTSKLEYRSLAGIDRVTGEDGKSEGFLPHPTARAGLKMDLLPGILSGGGTLLPGNKPPPSNSGDAGPGYRPTPALPPLAAVARDLSALEARFRDDASFRAIVYSVFRSLLTRESILALTTNSVFGRFWRAICERRKDEERAALIAQLQGVLSGMPPGPQLTAIRAWLDASYNKLAEVAAMVEAVADPYPCLVPDAKENFTAQELLDVVHSCAPKVLARVSRLIAGLRKVDGVTPGAASGGSAAPARGPGHEAKPNAADPKRPFLPLGLPDDELFSLLPHLLAPGTTVSLRGSAIFAAIALTSGNRHLATRATAFLASIRGRWINFETHPAENSSFSFVKLFTRPDIAAAALTPDEALLFAHMRRVGGLLINGRTQLEVQVPFTPPPKSTRPDYKLKCSACGHLRSFTLMGADGVCGLCKFDATEGAEAGDVLGPGRSAWGECKCCHGQYVIARCDMMNVAPKCHFCRFGRKPDEPADAPPKPDPSLSPVVTCVSCENRFVFPAWAAVNGTSPYVGTPSNTTAAIMQAVEAEGGVVEAEPAPAAGAEGTEGGAAAAASSSSATAPTRVFKCPTCATGSAPKTDTLEVALSKLMAETVANRHAVLARLQLEAEDGVDFFASNMSLYNARSVVKQAITFGDSDACGGGSAGSCLPPARLTFRAKRVMNAEAVLGAIEGWVGGGSAQQGSCSLCFDDVPRGAIPASPCGRRGCTTACCRDCLAAWYGGNAPGRLLMLSQLQCPFCKRGPSAKTISSFNAAACELVCKEGGVGGLEPGWWYGWCKTCNRPSQVAERECAVEPPVLDGFECPTCRAATAAAAGDGGGAAGRRGNGSEIRHCPRCDLATAKTAGCDHMSCPCGTHWCWACGKDCTDANGNHDTYDHLYKVHGGLSMDDPGDDDEDDYYD